VLTLAVLVLVSYLATTRPDIQPAVETPPESSHSATLTHQPHMAVPELDVE
jgi:hypothetical protein